MKTVGVYTENDYLFQKIRLELFGAAEVKRLTLTDSADNCDLILIDADNPHYVRLSGLRMKRGGGDIPLPFRLGSLAPLLDGKKESRLTLIPERKCARLDGVEIRLTELEYALLSLLTERKGGYASREEILDRVWQGRADKGIINVYVHYLREKLETGGEKIILSSRNYGYKINEKYLGGEADAQAY